MRTLLSRCAVLLAILLVSSLASAQIPGLVLNPTVAEFPASTDHAATFPLSGEPLVTEYQALYFGLDAQHNPTGQPVFSVSLGKPTPNQQGIVRMVDPFSIILPNVAYRLVIAAVGPGGTTGSLPSAPFGREQRTAPAAAGTPNVSRGGS